MAANSWRNAIPQVGQPAALAALLANPPARNPWSIDRPGLQEAPVLDRNSALDFGTLLGTRDLAGTADQMVRDGLQDLAANWAAVSDVILRATEYHGVDLAEIRRQTFLRLSIDSDGSRIQPEEVAREVFLILAFIVQRGTNFTKIVKNESIQMRNRVKNIARSLGLNKPAAAGNQITPGRLMAAFPFLTLLTRMHMPVDLTICTHGDLWAATGQTFPSCIPVELEHADLENLMYMWIVFMDRRWAVTAPGNVMRPASWLQTQITVMKSQLATRQAITVAVRNPLDPVVRANDVFLRLFRAPAAAAQGAAPNNWGISAEVQNVVGNNPNVAGQPHQTVVRMMAL